MAPRDLHADPRGAALAGPLAPPPPSPTLLAAVAGAAPASTRRPWIEAAAVAGLSTAWGAALLSSQLGGWRADLASVSPMRLAAVALAAAVTSASFLVRALVPPRGQVLPSLGPARLAAASAMALALLGLLLTGPAGPRSIVPAPGFASFLRYAAPCSALALAASLVPAALALRVLRGKLPLGGRRVGARIGTAAGALTALVITLHCPVAGVAHVGLVHGGEIIASVLWMSLLGGWLLSP